MLFLTKKVPSLTSRLLNFHLLTIWSALRVNYSGNVITEHFLTKATYAIKKTNPICKLIDRLSGSHSNSICHRMPEGHHSLWRHQSIFQFLGVSNCQSAKWLLSLQRRLPEIKPCVQRWRFHILRRMWCLEKQTPCLCSKQCVNSPRTAEQ